MKDGLIIDENGNKIWYQDGHYHRVDGPAIEYASGDKSWLQYGEYHRLDGPAIDWENSKQWWYRGKWILCSSQQEFEKIIKLKAFW